MGHKIYFQNAKAALFYQNKMHGDHCQVQQQLCLFIMQISGILWLVSRCIQRSHVCKYSLLPMATLYIWPLFHWNSASLMSLVSHRMLFLSCFMQMQLVQSCVSRSPCLGLFFSNDRLTGHYLFLICLFGLFAHSFTRSLVHSFIHSFIHSAIKAFLT